MVSGSLSARPEWNERIDPNPECFNFISDSNVDLLCPYLLWIQYLFSSSLHKLYSYPVLRIRDPAFFWSLDPGWKTDPYPGPGSGMNIQPIFPKALKIFKCFDADLDPGSGIVLTWIRDPDWKNSDPGSGINIPDAQHCIYLFPIDRVYVDSYRYKVRSMYPSWPPLVPYWKLAAVGLGLLAAKSLGHILTSIGTPGLPASAISPTGTVAWDCFSLSVLSCLG